MPAFFHAFSSALSHFFIRCRLSDGNIGEVSNEVTGHVGRTNEGCLQVWHILCASGEGQQEDSARRGLTASRKKPRRQR